MVNLFFKPKAGVSGDYIPFCEKDTFYLFYLHDFRENADNTISPSYFLTPWCMVETKDFVNFVDHGVMLPRGGCDEQDYCVYTGSVTKIGERYHIYYTGHNPFFRQEGRAEEAVMHAVSDDLLIWEKHPEDLMTAPVTGYERHDWRDPFLYYDEDEGKYWMLIVARSDTGADRRRGVIALRTSSDGIHWKDEGNFWEPGIYYAHECPDLFKMGDWYYLLFSEFSQGRVTRYVMSRSPKGPWIAPEDDRFDTCEFYAAKTAQGSGKRYLFGWLSTRAGDNDDGIWQWGGCLIVHQLFQRMDGTLGVTMPESIAQRLETFPDIRNIQLQKGEVKKFRLLGKLDGVYALEVEFQADEPKGDFEIAFACDQWLNDGYFLRMELSRRRVVLDRWPRKAEVEYEPGLERPIRLSKDGKYRMMLLVDGSAACAYINDDVALSFRMYNRAGAYWGVRFARNDGEISAREWQLDSGI